MFKFIQLTLFHMLHGFLHNMIDIPSRDLLTVHRIDMLIEITDIRLHGVNRILGIQTTDILFRLNAQTMP